MRTKQTASCGFHPFRRTLTLFLASSSLCRAVLVNRTIDSQYGDPTTGFIPVYHSPQHAWDDQTCGECYIQPDPARAFDRTWMAATYYPDYGNMNFTLKFTGVAIWVFFILSNANNHGTITITNTQCNFTLDGKLAGNVSHEPDLTTYDLIYNATVFSKTGLANTSHELLISVNDYPNTTFVNFDWAMYTIDVDPSTLTNTTSSSKGSATTSTSASQNTVTSLPKSSTIGIVVGSVLGAIVAVIVLALFILCRRSARSKVTKLDTFDIDAPYPTPIGERPYKYTPVTSTSDNTFQLTPLATLSSSHREQALRPDRGALGPKAAARRKAEITERIQSAQRELIHLTSLQDTSPANESGTVASPSRRDIVALRQEIEELRNQIEHRQNQPQSGSANEQPPAYS